VGDRYIDRDSVSLIGVQVEHRDLSGDLLDPTAYIVTVAVRPEGTRPASGDFKAATWFTGIDGTHWAQLNVGTGSSVGALSAGLRYKAHAKISVGTETPIVTSLDTIVIR
jgi:hypothetical protein